MNEQQKAVRDFLETININFAVIYRGETKREDWHCDAWRVSFTTGKASMETDYHTGLGLRKPHMHTGTIKPVPPFAADVLYSLILESGAIDTSFDYWCADYGYDSDSISAFNDYQACCKIGKDLRQVFSLDQIETLREL